MINYNNSPVLDHYKLCGYEQEFHNELEQKKKEYLEDEGIELSDDEVIDKIKLDYSLYYPQLVNSTRCFLIDTLKDYLTNTESDTHNINKSFEKCIHSTKSYKKRFKKK
ncbi:MAG: hypothetical protein U0L76_02615 [Ruminococcus sp.]|nr:hypothetical protein [Ruminococcus sp.]